jgi:hypothetical protein
MDMPQHAQNELYAWACELRRPCLLYKPRIYIDGDQWCALLGEDIQSGVCGFGDTPEKAFWNFDAAFCSPAIKPAEGTTREGEDGKIYFQPYVDLLITRAEQAERKGEEMRAEMRSVQRQYMACVMLLRDELSNYRKYDEGKNPWDKRLDDIKAQFDAALATPAEVKRV